MMRTAQLIICLPLAIMSAPSYDADRPIGKNCNLTSPPASAGEEMNHGVVLRIFPRAKDIGTAYTGCQVLFAPDGKKWITVALTEIIQGDPVRVWSDDEKDSEVQSCLFNKGKVVKGNPDKCPAPQFLLMKSLAPGCVRIIQAAVAKHGLGAPRTPECQYQ